MRCRVALCRRRGLGGVCFEHYEAGARIDDIVLPPGLADACTRRLAAVAAGPHAEVQASRELHALLDSLADLGGSLAAVAA